RRRAGIPGPSGNWRSSRARSSELAEKLAELLGNEVDVRTEAVIVAHQRYRVAALARERDCIIDRTQLVVPAMHERGRHRRRAKFARITGDRHRQRIKEQADAIEFERGETRD